MTATHKTGKKVLHCRTLAVAAFHRRPAPAGSLGDVIVEIIGFVNKCQKRACKEMKNETLPK